MQYLDLSDYPSKCYVCGDIYGEFAALVEEINQQRITNAIVIVAGDCGFGFEHPTYYDNIYKAKMHRRLEKANVLLLMVRGNYDDPIFFEKELIDYPYMKCLPDYLRTLPLHSSQKELESNDNYTIFEYHLRPTFDFYQLLLAQADLIEVLEPKSVRNKMREFAENLMNYYKC